MRVVIFGAGAIGSLFGAFLSKQHDVILIGRKEHVEMINSNGLRIYGKTIFHKKLSAVRSVDEVKGEVDLLLLTVKSFDTYDAIRQTRSIISKDTLILTFQNGLNNIDIIQSFISKDQILAGITTHGVVFSAPGIIHHTGIGRTIIGELDGSVSSRLNDVVKGFNDVGISISISDDIMQDIWRKGIVNSSINPLTAIFKCNNGYILDNPVLYHLLSCLCDESVKAARSAGYDLSKEEMINQTIQVINETRDNRSSMLQSVEKGSKTEIDSINGIIVTIGKKNNLSVILNESVCFIIKQLYS